MVIRVRNVRFGYSNITATCRLLYCTDNLYFPARYFVDHWEFQAIGNATLSVDSFFYLSGLLAVFLGLRELSKSNGRMNVPLMYLYRYIRYVCVFSGRFSTWCLSAVVFTWYCRSLKQVEMAQPRYSGCDFAMQKKNCFRIVDSNSLLLIYPFLDFRYNFNQQFWN